MLVPAYGGVAVGPMYNLWAFVCFELCVGIYFPSICTLKSEAVPESHRATIYNLLRAPMNLIVVTVLLVNPDLMPTFQIVATMLLMSGLTAALILSLPDSAGKGEASP